MGDVPAVVGIGEALWDVFCHEGGRVERRLGGAPANFAYHVAQQGLAACAVSAVGQDAAGESLAEELAQLGVPCVLQRVPYATGEVEVRLSGAGIPHYRILADAAWDHLAATPELLEMARHTRAVCFGSLAQRGAESRAAINAFVQAMPQGEGTWRLFDVNLRCGFYTPALLRESLRVADVLKLNDEELEVLGRMEGAVGLPQLEHARCLVQRYGLRLLILTCGSLGSYVLGAQGEVLSWLPTPEVEVVDTVGAGDAFTAVFLARLLRGLPVAEAHAAAVQVAACVCTQAGAMGVVPLSLRWGA